MSRMSSEGGQLVHLGVHESLHTIGSGASRAGDSRQIFVTVVTVHMECTVGRITVTGTG